VARVLLVKASNISKVTPAMVPPLGLMYLASTIRQKGGHQVFILDTRLYDDWAAQLDRCLQEYRPQVVGISAITREKSHMTAIAGRVKQRFPTVPVVAGGAHPTCMPGPCVEWPSIDVVVVGEAEEVIVPLIDGLLDRGDISQLPGVYTKESPPCEPLQPAPAPDLDALSLPAWDLVPIERYFRRRSMTSLSPWRYAVISTSRGCPFQCTYCHSVHGKRFRTRSVHSVGEELEYLKKVIDHGVVEVLDDCFNLKPDRAKMIMELFCRTGGRLRPSFSNGVRSDILDGEMLDLMAASQTAFVSFAIETASQRLQKAIKKNLNLEAVRQSIFEASRRGIYSNGFFMLGFPTETLGEMLETIRFSLSVPLVQAHFFKVIAFPGTELWASAMQKKLYTDRPNLEADYFFSKTNLSGVPNWQFELLYRLAYMAFYTRPAQLLSLFRNYPNKMNLVRRGLEVLAIVRNA
jgi:radical SAM superfamily enzyme YgiQ (UPF0313 family)